MADVTLEESRSRQDSSQLATTPFILVEGVPNFRDIGGLACAGINSTVDQASRRTRKHIRSGYLFRSAQPTQITFTGVSKLTTDLNVYNTFDLRSNKELLVVEKRFPGAKHDIAGVVRHHIPVYKDEEYSPISMAKKFNTDDDDKGEGSGRTAQSEARHSRDGFIHAYEDILRSAAQSGSFRAIMLHILENPQEPLLWHCTLGKDRTGIFAALVLKLCGVNDGEIVKDYALTTQGLGKWREYLVKRLMDGAGGEYVQKSSEDANQIARRPPTREEAERIIGSHAEDMVAFLEMLEDKFGGAKNYFETCCNLTSDQLAMIAQNLIVEER